MEGNKYKNKLLIKNKIYDSKYLLFTKEGQNILKRLRDEKQKTGNTNIYCLCKGKDNLIPMHAKRRPFNNSYTLGRDPNTKHLHSPECIRYYKKMEENIESYNHYRDIVIGEEWHEVFILLDNLIIEDKNTPKNEEHEIKRSKKLYKALEKIMTYAWYSYVKNIKNSYNPKEGNLFYEIYNIMHNTKVVIGNESNNAIELGKILFKPYKSIKNDNITNQLLKERKLLINNKIKTLKTLVIGKCSYIDGYKNMFKIKVNDPYLKNYYFLYADENLVINRYINEVEGSELYIIATVFPKNNMPFIDDIAFMPVYKDRGIYINNNYEKEVMKDLFKKNTLFIRVPRYEVIFDELFKDYIPDFILLNKKTRAFKAILEVFPYYKNYKNIYKPNNDLEFIKRKYKVYYWYKDNDNKIHKEE